MKFRGPPKRLDWHTTLPFPRVLSCSDAPVLCILPLATVSATRSAAGKVEVEGLDKGWHEAWVTGWGGEWNSREGMVTPASTRIGTFQSACRAHLPRAPLAHGVTMEAGHCAWLAPVCVCLGAPARGGGAGNAASTWTPHVL